MATKQIGFGDVEPETTDNTRLETVPRWLEDPSSIEEGAQITVDRNDHKPEQAYVVTRVRSHSIKAERDGNEIELRRKKGSWYHAGTDFSSTVKLISTPEKPVLSCSSCGEAHDPARFAFRSDYRFVCGDCNE
jgi:hypothetical protein